MRRFSVSLAGNILLVAFGAMIIVHMLVLRGVIPFYLLWGGMVDVGNLVGLELFAIGVSLFVMFVTASNLRYITPLLPRTMNITMWIICGYLLINTLGNLFSQNTIEQYYIAPITLVLAICAGRVAWAR